MNLVASKSAISPRRGGRGGQNRREQRFGHRRGVLARLRHPLSTGRVARHLLATLAEGLVACRAACEKMGLWDEVALGRRVGVRAVARRELVWRHDHGAAGLAIVAGPDVNSSRVVPNIDDEGSRAEIPCGLLRRRVRREVVRSTARLTIR